jgi:oligopeptide transport system ATP-binding protein
MGQEEVLLGVENLKMYFPIRTGVLQRHAGDVKAVDDVSFFIMKGETLGLVGESSCGKTTTGRAIIRLNNHTAGRIRFDGLDLMSLKVEGLRKMRRKMQMISQDPYASLNPRMNVVDIISEPLSVHRISAGKEHKSGWRS